MCLHLFDKACSWKRSRRALKVRFQPVPPLAGAPWCQVHGSPWCVLFTRPPYVLEKSPLQPSSPASCVCFCHFLFVCLQCSCKVSHGPKTKITPRPVAKRSFVEEGTGRQALPRHPRQMVSSFRDTCMHAHHLSIPLLLCRATFRSIAYIHTKYVNTLPLRTCTDKWESPLRLKGGGTHAYVYRFKECQNVVPNSLYRVRQRERELLLVKFSFSRVLFLDFSVRRAFVYTREQM